MDNIPITQPEIFIPDHEGFHPFKLKISKDEINSEQQLYFHKCLNAEYQEYSSARWDEPDVIQQSEENLQTVYFYNDENDYSAIQPTLQLDSKRTDEAAEGDVEERSDIPTTLYFINEEES